MKGIVFNVLEHCVTDQHGVDAWDELLEAAKLEGAYTSLGDYPDEDLWALVEAASKKLGVPPLEVQRWFGRSAMGPFSKRYPEMVSPHQDSVSFLLTLNDVIHPEVRKQYPGADVPVFQFETPGPGRISMRYTSARKMCAFAEGLLEAVACLFDEEVTIEQPTCMLRSDDACLIVSTFTKMGGHE